MSPTASGSHCVPATPMTTEALPRPIGLAATFGHLREGTALPVTVVLLVTIVAWYLGAIWLNSGLVEQRFEQTDKPATLIRTQISFLLGTRHSEAYNS